MSNNVVSIAKDILRLAYRRDEVMTQMKLLKLTYIAYGFYLAIYDQKLFPERIEAWKYGPVIPKLYQYTQKFGSAHVPPPEDDVLECPDLERFLKKLLDVYLKYEAVQLSNLTHRQSTPWSQVIDPDRTQRNHIPDEIIKPYYQKLSQPAQSMSA